MADDVIFMRQNTTLVPLAVSPYDAESALQELLEHHPQLLAGAQMNRSEPRRFLLVRREVPVADHEGGGGRWSIDHLFLDQDAIPTLVEVKRSSDSRIRREVVGQMLDYAANGPRYWAPHQLRQLFETTCADTGQEPNVALGLVIGDNADMEDFWTQAGRNLRGGTLRLVFVADIIPGELRAIIEFLNARMTDTEVYGVEVSRYSGEDGQECFVPRLVGDVVSADVEGRPAQSLDDMFDKAMPETREVRDKVVNWALEVGLSTRYSPASFQVRDAFGPVVRVYPTFNTMEIPLADLWTAGRQSEIENAVGVLSAVVGKKMSDKAPNVPCREALANWDRVQSLLGRLLAVRVEALGSPAND